jgi:hypothetical protein
MAANPKCYGCMAEKCYQFYVGNDCEGLKSCMKASGCGKD